MTIENSKEDIEKVSIRSIVNNVASDKMIEIQRELNDIRGQLVRQQNEAIQLQRQRSTETIKTNLNTWKANYDREMQIQMEQWKKETELKMRQEMRRSLDRRIGIVENKQESNEAWLMNYSSTLGNKNEQWKIEEKRRAMEENELWRQSFTTRQKEKMEEYQKTNDLSIGSIIEEKIKIIALDTRDIYQTKIESYSDETKATMWQLKNTSGIGIIDQILIKSDLSTYTYYMMIDNNILFNKVYTWFSTNSDYLENISAFLEGGDYYLSIRGLKFKENFLIRIIPAASTVFGEVLLKYTIRDEINV